MFAGTAVLLVAGAAVLDAIRYLKPGVENKIQVKTGDSINIDKPEKLIFVYNAYGGIFPGIVDIIHKEFFPKTYPCNLCYQAFGTFGKKDQWINFLETIALQKEEFHKDDFSRHFQYNSQLPVILISGNEKTTVLVPASRINQAKSLDELITITKKSLQENDYHLISE